MILTLEADRDGVDIHVGRLTVDWRWARPRWRWSVQRHNWSPDRYRLYCSIYTPLTVGQIHWWRKP